MEETSLRGKEREQERCTFRQIIRQPPTGPQTHATCTKHMHYSRTGRLLLQHSQTVTEGWQVQNMHTPSFLTPSIIPNTPLDVSFSVFFISLIFFTSFSSSLSRSSLILLGFRQPQTRCWNCATNDNQTGYLTADVHVGTLQYQ